MERSIRRVKDSVSALAVVMGYYGGSACIADIVNQELLSMVYNPTVSKIRRMTGIRNRIAILCCQQNISRVQDLSGISYSDDTLFVHGGDLTEAQIFNSIRENQLRY